MKPILLALTLGSSVAFVTPSIAQTPPTSTGTRFWLGFMENYQGNNFQALEIFISSLHNTNGTVSMPLLGWSQDFTVTANMTTTVTVPLTAMHVGSEVVESKSFLIETEDPVAVFAINFEQYTADGTAVYPEGSLGHDYRIFSYRGLSGWGTLNSEFLIVATEDGTQVEITPTAPTLGGQPAGVPFVVNLDAGQTYQVQAAGATNDLTGSTIVGTELMGSCRPFAVFSGAACTHVPFNCTACDHIYSQNLPRSAWGTQYFSVPFNGQPSYVYRIMADTDGTVVTRNGANPVVLNAGEYFDENTSNAAICFEGNNAFGVAQYMKGGSCSLTGDPSMLILHALEHKTNHAVFATVQSTVINAHFLNIVVEAADVALVMLNGSLVPSTLFNPYPGCPSMAYASMPIPQGSYTLSSPGGLTAYVYGTGGYESYAFSVGAYTPQTPAGNVDAVYCGVDINGQVTMVSPETLQDPVWSSLDEPNDTLHIGSSFTFTPTTSELFLVSGLSDLSSCPVQYLYSVELEEAPYLSITLNGLEPPFSVCAYTTVQLGVTPDPQGSYLYNWTSEAPLSDASAPNPTAIPTNDTWFSVSVSTLHGCATATDSILVTTTPGNVYLFGANADREVICLGDTVELGITAHYPLVQDDFDDDPSPMWSMLSNAAISDQCGSVSGNALLFDGVGNRFAMTVPLDVSGGGTIRFSLKIADGEAPCGDAAPGHNVRLMYSLDGQNWVGLNSYQENLYPEFTPIVHTLPPAALTTETRFRWSQPLHGGPGQSNWAIDDVRIVTQDPEALNVVWQPEALLITPGIPEPSAQPLASGWFTVMATDPDNGCAYKDSVHVQVIEAFTLNTMSDTLICQGSSAQLIALPQPGPAITWLWEPDDGTLSSISDPAPMATPEWTTTYSVTVDNTEGCRAYGTMTVLVDPGHLTTLQFNLDDHGSETTWTLIDQAIQEVVGSGGPYADTPGGESLEVRLCLGPGCYLLRIEDSGGNGMCCEHGTGSYQVIDYLGTSQVEGNGVFGDLVEHVFCVSPIGIMEQQTQRSVLHVWPVPATHQIQVAITGPGLYTCSITDASGRLTGQSTLLGDHHSALDVSGLSSGSYVLCAEREGHRHYARFIVQH